MTRQLRTRVEKTNQVIRLAASTGSVAAGGEKQGQYGAGLLTGVSLCTRGVARGWSLWCDQTFVESVTAAAAENKVTKCRFTHPGLCADGMGKALGTIADVQTSKDGNQSIGNLSFFSAARSAPDGDLAGYVETLAAEAPALFGLSIVYACDANAEIKFAIEHGAELAEDADGPYLDLTNFKSPDPLNVDNLVHARLATLQACDVVDEPAANPSGLFYRANPLLQSGWKVLDYLLGQTDQLGQVDLLHSFGTGLSPERVRSFVSQYLAAAGLVVRKERSMTTKLANPDDEDPKKDPVPEEVPEDKTDPADPADPAPAAPGDPTKKNEDDTDEEKSMSLLKRFCKAFGNEAGAQYVLSGISFETALEQELVKLRTGIKERDDKLSAFAKLGVNPVGFTAAEDPNRSKSQGDVKPTGDPSGDNRAAFAAAIAKPSVN